MSEINPTDAPVEAVAADETSPEATAEVIGGLRSEIDNLRAEIEEAKAQQVREQAARSDEVRVQNLATERDRLKAELAAIRAGTNPAVGAVDVEQPEPGTLIRTMGDLTPDEDLQRLAAEITERLGDGSLTPVQTNTTNSAAEVTSATVTPTPASATTSTSSPEPTPDVLTADTTAAPGGAAPEAVPTPPVTDDGSRGETADPTTTPNPTTRRSR